MSVATLDDILVFPADPDARLDLQRLQGTWASVEGRRDLEFTFSGCQFAARFRDGEAYSGYYELVPDERPRTMIMWIHDGPDRHQGLAAMCIYDVCGDELWWCPSQPGADDPPSEFPPVDDGRFLCTRFQRVKTGES